MKRSCQWGIGKAHKTTHSPLLGTLLPLFPMNDRHTEKNTTTFMRARDLAYKECGRFPIFCISFWFCACVGFYCNLKYASEKKTTVIVFFWPFVYCSAKSLGLAGHVWMACAHIPHTARVVMEEITKVCVIMCETWIYVYASCVWLCMCIPHFSR